MKSRRKTPLSPIKQEATCKASAQRSLGMAAESEKTGVVDSVARVVQEEVREPVTDRTESSDPDPFLHL